MLTSPSAHDWIQISTVLIALGVFVNQARGTRILVDQHEQRLRGVETQSAATALLLVRATTTLDKLEERLEKQESELLCDEHMAMMAAATARHESLHEEVSRLRDRVDRSVK